MTDTPSKKDPTADWPEEIKQAYEHLKIPSLYDAILANEKISLEMRRQDRELQAIKESIQTLSTQLHSLMNMMEGEWEEYEEETLQTPQNGFKDTLQEELTDLEEELLQESQFYQEKQAQSILMETHDNMRDLSRLIGQTIHQLFALLPKKEGIIPHPPAWYPITEQMLQSIVESVERFRYQLLVRLEDMHIEMVDPQPGETFDASLHHAIDHISGGKSGTIARVVRVGYRQDKQVLRLADVTIYQ
jgi:molecular chaperone GrpE (heat shock protein)